MWPDLPTLPDYLLVRHARVVVTIDETPAYCGPSFRIPRDNLYVNLVPSRGT